MRLAGAGAGRSTEGKVDLAGMHVLIVDDSINSKRALKGMVQPTGADVSLAGSDDPLLEMVYDLAPDIILIAVSEPLDPGLGITAMIRDAQDAAGTGRCPILAITDNAFAEDRRRCLEAGVDGVIVRHLTRSRLFSALGKISAGPQQVH